MPGIAMPASFMGPLAEVPVVDVTAPPGGAIGGSHGIEGTGTVFGARLADNASQEPAPEAAARFAEPGAEPLADEADADGREESETSDSEGSAEREVTVLNRISALLATPKGKWIAAAIAAAVVLIVLSVVLAVRSHSSDADVTQVSDDSTPATSSGPPPSNPPAPDPSAVPSAPLPPDPQVAGGAADPYIGSPSGALPPDGAVPPPDPSMDDLSAPNPATPPGPDPYGTQLDQNDPFGPDPTQASPQDPALSNPTTQPGNRPAAPRKTGPLNSLNSITTPDKPGATGRDNSDSQRHGKSVGDDLTGLGHGL
jgi:hypothetical protein